jgi:N-acetylglutamate synthase-like GNAT family acetyltransferase
MPDFLASLTSARRAPSVAHALVAGARASSAWHALGAPIRSPSSASWHAAAGMVRAGGGRVFVAIVCCYSARLRRHCGAGVVIHIFEQAGTMIEAILRHPTAGDAAAIAELSEQLGYPSTAAEVARRLQNLSNQHGDLVLVAEREGQVVGWMHAFIAYRLESAPFAEIAGLVVDHRQRGAGIGGQLVAAARAWTARHELRELRVRSNTLREETHRFYRERGFALSKSQCVFALPIHAA